MRENFSARRSRVVRWAFLIGFLFALPLMGACGAIASESTACDGLVYKESGLTRKEYLPCAGEMIATLDHLDTQVEKMIDGEQSARSEASSSVRTLGSLMKKAGGRNLLERWSDRALTNLNLDISNAYGHHQACMMVAGQLGDKKYRDAAKSECRAYRNSYQEAKSAYRSLR